MIYVYATTKDGDGLVSTIGEYENLSDLVERFELRTGMYSDDILINMWEDHEKKD